MTNALSTRNLGFSTGGATLLEGVDFMAVPGELVAVVGPNGAGKSTFLRLLGGDLTPTHGDVHFEGQSVSSLEPEDLALRRALLGQRAPTDIPFSANAVVMLGRYPHRRSGDNSSQADHAAVLDAMERCDVTHLADRTFATLSAGEQTRVSLARILAQDAGILLLDEPTTALDVGHQEKVMQELAALAGRGRTVIAVLHDLNAAAHYATRVVLVGEGRIGGDGDPREIFSERTLSAIYGQKLRVVDHPFRDCPLVLVDASD